MTQELNEALTLGNRKNFNHWHQLKSDLDLTILGKSQTARLSGKNAYNLAKVKLMVVDLKLQLNSILNKVLTKRITPSEFEIKFKQILKLGHEQAYLRGMQAGGYDGEKIPSIDYKWLTKSRYDEHDYLDGFVDDIKNRKFKLDPYQRAGMYADAVLASYNVGRNVMMPNNMMVYWVLEPGNSPRTGKPVEHCKTCLWMAANNPFTPRILPLTPKNNTNCHSNCLCKLQYVKTNSAAVEAREHIMGSAKDILKRMAKVDAYRP